MKASHVLTLTATAAALALALAVYAVAGNAVRGISPSADRPGPAHAHEGATPDDGGAWRLAPGAWRQALAPLVTELATLKQTQAGMSAMQGDVGRLKTELAELRRRLEAADSVDGRRSLKLQEIWTLRTRLQLDHKTWELALFDLALDSKLRGQYARIVKSWAVLIGVDPHEYGTIRYAARKPR